MEDAKKSQTKVIEVRDLALKIDDHQILSDINFSIDTGKFVGLIGPNGAGKSSLLRSLYRYTTPTMGEIVFLGKSLCHYSRQDYARQVAVVLQEIPDHFNLSVFDVVAMGVLPHKSLFSAVSLQDKLAVASAIDKVGLSDKTRQPFSYLSGGEKQRVLIARAIVQQPVFLIMDEPTSHLDVKYQIQIMELAKSLNITVLASFHDLNLAGALCDEILVLKEGALVAHGKPLDVFNAQLLADVYGVCASVSSVSCPYEGIEQVPHIRYHYGYAL
ncbi:ABC transporter ATP-binding protein [Pseudoalteromonas sp. MMG013]|uniref:ABC transporter ATP-binding protein n=1 Tax=Pseudoalteromonas sp. MMG013 TaxID=2822687 RepID=UPI001B38435B|nr:ABC transporter ATP-binding protein [Pseudoalteromonas sp. MMG013]